MEATNAIRSQRRFSPAAPAALACGAADDALDFMRLLWGVEHGLTRVSRHMERSLGLTGPQRHVIRIVGRNPEISAGALARLLRLHPSTLTSVLHRLVRRGALARLPDPRDARRALFQLTRKGKRLDALRAGTVEERVRDALSRTPEPELAAVRRFLATLIRSLGGDG
jgi:MarR family transcriptional regulator, organic hydroperoxide resistance regulator